ncbi:MAG TPA: peptidyl-prolyl cis-trans isomerase [Verrucomicrobiae bacterium]|nr:peptidyl-prolyl cis-trans isomerase [Verrucomicrobiae bacterium]
MRLTRLVLLACGVAALAAGSVLAAPKQKKNAPPAKTAAKPANDSDVVLVRIGNDTVTPRDLANRLQELPEQYRAQYTTPDGKQKLLDRLVEEKIWMRDADANGVTKRPDVIRQIEASKRDLLIRTWVNEVMAKNAPPSDSEAKVYYDAHKDEWKTPANVTLKHIQLKTQADAKRVLGLAKAKGADWDKLVKQYSADTLTKVNGGSLGTATRDGGFVGLGVQVALVDSAMALGAGKIGGPWKTDKGWHVVKVESVREESIRDFDQVRSFIVRQIGQERTQTYYQDQVTRLKSQYKVSPDSSAIKNWMSAKKSARDMFQEAQAAGDADTRIAAYRKVVDEYPDADVTPQALFMVGFINSEEKKDYDAAERVFRELLQKYPKSELAASAQWMVDHMRTDEVPDFLHADSTASAPKKTAAKGGGSN